MSKKQVTMWTDGSCMGNPGPCAGAAILTSSWHVLAVGDAYGEGTNNIAEIGSVITGIETLKQSSAVTLYTDSMYVINGIKRLQRNSILKTNVDWWIRLRKILKSKKHEVILNWIPGHAESDENKIVDHIARHCANHQKPFMKKYLSISNAEEEWLAI